MVALQDKILPLQSKQEIKNFEAVVERWDLDHLDLKTKQKTLVEEDKTDKKNKFRIDRQDNGTTKEKPEYHNWRFHNVAVQLGGDKKNVYACVLIPAEFHINIDLIRQAFLESQKRPGSVVVITLAKDFYKVEHLHQGFQALRDARWTAGLNWQLVKRG